MGWVSNMDVQTITCRLTLKVRQGRGVRSEKYASKCVNGVISEWVKSSRELSRELSGGEVSKRGQNRERSEKVRRIDARSKIK